MKLKQAIKKFLFFVKDNKIDELQLTFDLQGDYAEFLYSSQLLAQRDGDLFQLVEEIFTKISGDFGGWALTKSSLQSLVANIDRSQLEKEYSVVELGGGLSTLFWREMNKRFPKLMVTTWEHNQQFIDTLNHKVVGSSVRIEHRKLQQYRDLEWGKIFSSHDLKGLEAALIESKPADLPLSEYCNTRAHNTFYDISNIDFRSGKIDLLVVDGPHGNGRSLAFAAFAKYITEGTIILIDDVSHYPFLEMLSKFVTFQIVSTSFSLNKQWIILRVVSSFE